jgi:DNA-binding NarL/FixJ family response regulator
MAMAVSGKTALVADDDEFFRMALRSILTSQLGFAEVVETASLDEAVERLSDTESVTLALFDLAMPGMESAASLRAVRECFPDTQAAVVSASTRRVDVLLALEAGAHGYVPKSLGVAELSRALRSITEGVIYVPAFIADLSTTAGEPDLPLASTMSRNEHPEPSLTTRQRQVLEHLVAGRSNKEIARALNLGEGTVKVHVAALFRVLGVTSRAAAAAAGARLIQAE